MHLIEEFVALATILPLDKSIKTKPLNYEETNENSNL